MALLLCFASCAGLRPAAPSRAAASAAPPFLLTFWCGPPNVVFDDARAAQIAAAGFTVVGAPCEGPTSTRSNRAVLDIAAAHGLRVLLRDARLSIKAVGTPGWRARAAAAVAAYRGHPGLAGYFLTDEPSADDFPALAKLVALLRRADPHALAYINLYPNFVPAKRWGTPTYTAYLRNFARIVRPALLSYDNYPFLAKKDRPGFRTNLTAVRDIAALHHLPFMTVVQTMPHGPYRDPTEAELAWQVYQALAYGARGISYFAYWTPVHVVHAKALHFRYGLIERGKPTLHYFQVMRLNRAVRAIVGALGGLRPLGVVDSAGGFGLRLPIGPLVGIAGGRVTAGLFAGGQTLAALLVNRDYRYGASVHLRLRPGAAPPEAFDVAGRRWQLGGTTFLLPPGGARLLRWHW